MGYTTNFNGSFELDKPLTDEHRAYLEAFNNTRRMARDASKAALLDDPVRIAAGLPIGERGAYYVGAKGLAGQDRDDSIIDYNQPPKGQPGLWCQWMPDDGGGATIVWDQSEKFYHYVEWLEYLIEHFLQPWDTPLPVRWSGMGRIATTSGA